MASSTYPPAVDEIKKELDRVDWDFPDARTLRSSIHTLHWFPGNFVPPLPSYLIQILSKPDDLVFDPFCGSGTTGAEALLLGRRTLLSDINSASLHISKGKMCALTCPGVLNDIDAVASELLSNLSIPSDRIGQQGEGSNRELELWFENDTLSQLRHVWTIIESVPNRQSRLVLETVFSDTLFVCASAGRPSTSGGGKRRHHWGWIADNVVPSKRIWHDAAKIFRQRLSRAYGVIASLGGRTLPQAQVERVDISALDVTGRADLVVTSPPYLGMIDYALANRLSYLWFNWPLTEDKVAEIGARYRRNRQQEEDVYLKSMERAARSIAQALRRGGYCAVVIGNSRKFPAAAEAVLRLFATELRLVWGPIARTPTRTRIAERSGRQPLEMMSVFQKADS